MNTNNIDSIPCFISYKAVKERLDGKNMRSWYTEICSIRSS